MFGWRGKRVKLHPKSNANYDDVSFFENREEETIDYNTNHLLLLNSYKPLDCKEVNSKVKTQNKCDKTTTTTTTTISFNTSQMQVINLSKRQWNHINKLSSQDSIQSGTKGQLNKEFDKMKELKQSDNEDISIWSTINEEMKIGYYKRNYYEWVNHIDYPYKNTKCPSYDCPSHPPGYAMKKLIPTNPNNISIWTNIIITPFDKINLLTASINKTDTINEDKKKGIITAKEGWANWNSTISNIRIGWIDNNIIRKTAQEYLHSIKGNLRVYCRIKPMADPSESFITFPEKHWNQEIVNNQITTIELKPKDKISNNSTSWLYHFDRIFPQNSTQREIFLEIKHFIQSAWDGDNICIFAYGATGSGKTYTMQGNNNNNSNQKYILVDENSGIWPRCAEYIFEEKIRLNQINERIELSLAAWEIYNENVYDLWAATPKSGNNNGGRSSLSVYCANNEVNIPNWEWKWIETKDDLIKFTNIASDCRKSDATCFNSVSSRSHALFQIKIYNSTIKKHSMINIIDWAGSERNQATGNLYLNENMKKLQNEANFINKSWTALGRIINWIGDKKNCNKISIPYRESKLTMILQNYLKFNSKTAMIVNIAAEMKSYNYTKESLTFASNAMMSC